MDANYTNLVEDKTRLSATSKNLTPSPSANHACESGQILLISGSLVLSTTIN